MELLFLRADAEARTPFELARELRRQAVTPDSDLLLLLPTVLRCSAPRAHDATAASVAEEEAAEEAAEGAKKEAVGDWWFWTGVRRTRSSDYAVDYDNIDAQSVTLE